MSSSDVSTHPASVTVHRRHEVVAGSELSYQAVIFRRLFIQRLSFCKVISNETSALIF